MEFLKPISNIVGAVYSFYGVYNFQCGQNYYKTYSAIRIKRGCGLKKEENHNCERKTLSDNEWETKREREQGAHCVLSILRDREHTAPVDWHTAEPSDTHTHKHRHTAKLVRAPVEHTPNINPCKLGISLLFCSKSSKGLSQISVSSRFSLLAWCAPFSRKWWSCFSSPQCSHFVTRLIYLIFHVFF